MDPANKKSPHRSRQSAPERLAPNWKVLVANGAGATVIPSGSWLHELDEEDFAGNGFQKANGRPHC
jgi:hypothetical protein